jgi:hypothetical protein
MNAIIESIGNWFGFVGSCVASPTGACVPFVIFLTIAVAASAVLAGIYFAYRAATQNEAVEPRRNREWRVYAAAMRARLRAEPRAGKPSRADTVHGPRHATA